MLEAGVNLRVIQCLLGHRSPKTTAIYTHVTPQVMDSVSSTLNQCHTVVPYLLVRPALRKAMQITQPTSQEARLLDK